MSCFFLFCFSIIFLLFFFFSFFFLFSPLKCFWIASLHMKFQPRDNCYCWRIMNCFKWGLERNSGTFLSTVAWSCFPVTKINHIFLLKQVLLSHPQFSNPHAFLSWFPCEVILVVLKRIVSSLSLYFQVPTLCCLRSIQRFRLHLFNALWHCSLKPMLVF